MSQHAGREATRRARRRTSARTAREDRGARQCVSIQKLELTRKIGPREERVAAARQRARRTDPGSRRRCEREAQRPRPRGARIRTRQACLIGPGNPVGRHTARRPARPPRDPVSDAQRPARLANSPAPRSALIKRESGRGGPAMARSVPHRQRPRPAEDRPGQHVEGDVAACVAIAEYTIRRLQRRSSRLAHDPARTASPRSRIRRARPRRTAPVAT